VKNNDTFEYKNINEVLKDVSANTLDMIVLNTDYDDLNRAIKEKYERVCEDDEMNKKRHRWSSLNCITVISKV
jgi:hypothetical protein